MVASILVWQLLILRWLAEVGILCSLDGGPLGGLDAVSLWAWLGLVCLGEVGGVARVLWVSVCHHSYQSPLNEQKPFSNSISSHTRGSPIPLSLQLWTYFIIIYTCKIVFQLSNFCFILYVIAWQLMESKTVCDISDESRDDVAEHVTRWFTG